MKNKVMIVSGGASGLGLAAAVKFAQKGYDIVLVDVNEEKGRKAEEQIRAMGQDAVFCLCDISNKEQVTNAAATARERFGRADALINNAGLEIRGSILQCSEEDWVRTYDINLKGIYYMSNAFVPLMLSHDDACAIINTGSVTGLTGSKELIGLRIVEGRDRDAHAHHGLRPGQGQHSGELRGPRSYRYAAPARLHQRLARPGGNRGLPQLEERPQPHGQA